MHASLGKGVRLLNFTFLKIKFTSYRFSPSTEKPSTEKPSTEKPSTEKPITEKPITEKPITEKPITDKPITDKPSTNNTDKSHFMRRNTQHFRHWLYLYPKVTVKADLRHFHLISNTLYGWYWCHIYLQNKKVVFSNKWATIMYFVALSHSSHTFTWLGRYAAAMCTSAFCLFPLGIKKHCTPHLKYAIMILD